MLTQLDFKNITLPFLKRLCKRVITNYSKLNKKELFIKYNRYISAIVIQKWYRKHFYRNAVDSITFETVSFPCFVFCILPGKFFFYAYDSIIRYIMKSGKTIDPCTRVVYPDNILERLDQAAKLHFPDKKYKSTLKIKKSEIYAKRIINRENEIMAHQSKMNNLKESILELLDNGILDIPLGSILIRTRNYNSITEYFIELITELKILLVWLKKKEPWSADVFIELFSTNLSMYPEILNKII